MLVNGGIGKVNLKPQREREDRASSDTVKLDVGSRLVVVRRSIREGGSVRMKLLLRSR